MEQVSAYRRGMEMGCRDVGNRRGDPQRQIDAFCECMMDTFEKSLTPEDWKLAYFQASRRQDREEMHVLRPHMPKVRACHSGS